MLKYFVTDRRIKTMSQLKESLIKSLTKGNVFLYNFEPNKEELLAESRRKAEAFATEMIREGLDTIPSRIKRDIEV